MADQAIKYNAMVKAIAEYVSEQNMRFYPECEEEVAPLDFGTNKETVLAYLQQRSVLADVVTEMKKLQK